MMTKKDFIQIAEFMSTLIVEDATKEYMIKAMVLMFSESNPRFDEDRFRKACESP